LVQPCVIFFGIGEILFGPFSSAGKLVRVFSGFDLPDSIGQNGFEGGTYFGALG
jgi:hypothetical protein